MRNEINLITDPINYVANLVDWMTAKEFSMSETHM